jgi:hypothetical protein
MPDTRFVSVGLVLALGVFLKPEGSCQAGSNDSSGNSSSRHSSKQSKSVATGVWGGEHIRMEVTESGATVEYDCGNGTIAGPLKLDGEGRFHAAGNRVPEHGGPVRDGEAPAARPADYSGSVRGETMTLTVTLASPSETIGTFTLVHGSEGELVKCR